MAALLNLAELADDPEIARRSAMLLDVMFFDMAIDSFRGSYGTSHGRTYADGIVAGGLSEATTGLQRIAWGMGNLGGAGNSAANYLAAGKRYKVARTIQVVAGLFPEELTNRERQSLLIDDAERRFGLDYDDPFDFFLLNQAGRHSSIETIERTRKVMAKMNSRLYDHVGLPYSTALLATYRELAKQGKPVPNLDRQALPRVDKITYRTPDYQLSAAQDYRKGGPGASQHIWQATLGPGTMVFAIHPGATPKQMLGRLPRVGQHKNLLFVVHDIPTEPYPGPKVVVPPDVGEFRPSPAPSRGDLRPAHGGRVPAGRLRRGRAGQGLDLRPQGRGLRGPVVAPADHLVQGRRLRRRGPGGRGSQEHLDLPAGPGEGRRSVRRVAGAHRRRQGGGHRHAR